MSLLIYIYVSFDLHMSLLTHLMYLVSFYLQVCLVQVFLDFHRSLVLVSFLGLFSRSFFFRSPLKVSSHLQMFVV